MSYIIIKYPELIIVGALSTIITLDNILPAYSHCIVYDYD